MSLLSKGLGRLTANINRLGPAKHLLKAIPGVGVALAANDIYQMGKQMIARPARPVEVSGAGGDPNQWGTPASVLAKQARGESVSQNEMDAAFPQGFVQQAGVGSAIGRIGGRIGPMIGRAGRSTAGKAVIGGAAGAVGWELGEQFFNGHGRPRSRRMNYLNQRALTRANRRVCGFADISVKTLRQLGYTVSASRKHKQSTKKRRRCA